MPKIYRISKAGLRLYYKVRHHRGHGIHSPFVYNLITRVIEEKLLYYKYKDIQETVYNCQEINKKVTKYDLLSFRLVNYFNPVNILELGAGYGINALCLTAPSGKINCTSVELSPKRAEIAKLLLKGWNGNIKLYTQKDFPLEEKTDCVYINLNYYFPDIESLMACLFKHTHEESFLIIKGIRTNKRNYLLWMQLRKSEKTTVSLDLYHEGILFFNPKLYKRNYKISF
ncbi:MAG: class I SAM-dependent methyltransferase [Dysgonomonas sp.]